MTTPEAIIPEEITYCDQKYRDSCKDKLMEVTGSEELAKKIEESIYSYSRIKAENRSRDERKSCFNRNYLNKLCSLYNNLDLESSIKNVHLFDRFKEGDLDPEKAAYYTPQELYPEKWEELLKTKSAVNDFLYKKEPMVVTDKYTCGRCKKNKCTYYFLQVRSCDEPSTMFITCLNCWHKW